MGVMESERVWAQHCSGLHWLERRFEPTRSGCVSSWRALFPAMLCADGQRRLTEPPTSLGFLSQKSAGPQA